MKTITRKAIGIGAAIGTGLTLFVTEALAVIHATCHLLGIEHPF